MSEKFKGKYRNESARLRNWDYGSDAAYFITICTKDREHYLGQITNEKMQVSPAGAIAHVLWFEIKNHVKNIELGEFVVMPNHIHGILILNGNNGRGYVVADDGRDVAADDGRDVAADDGRDVACNVPTESDNQKNDQMAAISPKSNTISSIIRSYKSAVTKYCNRLGLPMAWQPRFHDHIIRNDESFKRISEYIKNNPSNWKDDTFK
jgi:REP element-mobilizing transposase RayT